MNKLELFLTISGGVVYWQTPGLKEQKWLIDSIDVPFQYCFDLKDNRGAFAVFNHPIKDEHYVSVNCGVLGKDDRGRSDAPYRFHAILPWAIYKDKLGADAFALARWAFSKEVLSRRYGNTKGEEEGELFSPQVYNNLPPKAERRPDVVFLKKHLADQQQLGVFLGALIAGVAPPLRFRDEGHASQWSTYDPWSERILTNGERLLEELYLCLPYETRSGCNISTGWKQCDFKFHLALDNESSDNAAVALKRVVDALDENARSKAQVVVEQYVNPLFQAIEKENDQSINQLRRYFTLKSIAWKPEKTKQHEPKKLSCVGDVPNSPNNGWLALAKHPFVIGAMVVMLVIGFGIARLFPSKSYYLENVTAKLEKLQSDNKDLTIKFEGVEGQLNLVKDKFGIGKDKSFREEILNLKQLLEKAKNLNNTTNDKKTQTTISNKSLQLLEDSYVELVQAQSALNNFFKDRNIKLSSVAKLIKEVINKLDYVQDQLKLAKYELGIDENKSLNKIGDFKTKLGIDQSKTIRNGIVTLKQQLDDVQAQLNLAKRELGIDENNTITTISEEIATLKKNSQKLTQQLNLAKRELGIDENDTITISEEIATLKKNSQQLNLAKRELGIGEDDSLSEKIATLKKNSQQLNQAKRKLGIGEDDSLIEEIANLKTNSQQLTEQKTIVINEIAWMGTSQNGYDEWIELYNYGIRDINLYGWKLFVSGKSNPLYGTIKKGEFLVLKRSSSKGSQETSFQWQTTFNNGALWDDLSKRNTIPLILRDKNNKIIDQVNKWYAGQNNEFTTHTTHTMTRKNPLVSGTISQNWCSSPKNETPYYIESNCFSCNADYGTPGQWNLCNE